MVYFDSSISVCNSVDQAPTLTMANSSDLQQDQNRVSRHQKTRNKRNFKISCSTSKEIYYRLQILRTIHTCTLLHISTVPICFNATQVYMANELVDEMMNHNTMPDGHKRRWAVDATFVDYWLKQGEDERAMEIYRSLISRKEEEVVCAATGNALLEMLFDNGKQTGAWELFNAMITNSKTFNRETFGIMVNVCFKLGLFKEALETFRRPELTRSSSCYANIIAKFCDRGKMSEAQDLFMEMCSDQYFRPDVPTFRSMINGYAKAGRVDDAIEMLKKMVDATLFKFAVHEAP